MTVCVRFAPSPTGFLHLGGLRTALYNYLFARKHGGQFVLRIEDTDQSRIVPSSIGNIIEVLDWAGIRPDKGPFNPDQTAHYVQSARVKLYNEKAQELLDKGLAYRCFCSSTRLELLRKEAIKNRSIPRYDNRCRHLNDKEIDHKLAENKSYALRFRTEEQTVSVDDMIYEKTVFDLKNSDGDFVILKSDSFPSYHLANVVDDHAMGITHVLRGEEWLISTPKHLLIYKAFGWEPPRFAHIPILLNEDGKKLSKRHQDLGVMNLKARGFYPDTIINYLILSAAGFETKPDHLASLEEIVDKFDLSDINRARVKVSYPKLKAFNRHAIHEQLKANKQGFLLTLRDYLRQKFGDKIINNETDEHLIFLFTESQGRYANFGEFADEIGFVWTPCEPSWPCDQFLALGDIEGAIESVLSEIDRKWEQSETRIDKLPFVKQFCSDNQLDYRLVMRFIRLSLVSKEVGLPVGQMLFILGKDEFMKRVRLGIDYTKKQLANGT